MRGAWSTLALVLVLAGLGAYIYFVDSKRPEGGATVNEKVFTVEPDKIQEIRVAAPTGSTTLVRKESGWTITEPMATDADPTESASLVTNIASMEQTRVVDENAPDLAAYGLAEPNVRVAFKADGNISGEVHLGDKTPTMGDIYAVKAGTTRVFLVPSYVETTFDKGPFNLRDKRVVKFERDKADRLEVTREGSTIRMVRDGSEWTVESPRRGRADYATVEGLLTRLSTAGMASIIETPSTDLKQYGLAPPVLRIQVSVGSSQTTLEVGTPGPDGGRPYARDVSRPLIFTLDTVLGDDLSRSFDDFHKKDLFEARSFTADSVRVTRLVDGTPKTWEFVKKSGDAGETWQVTPEGGQAIEADRAKVDEFLNALAAIRFQTLVDTTAKTGLERPLLNVGISYDKGKFERVRIGEAGRHYANREGEQVTGEVETPAVMAALAALDDAIKPPAAATDTTAKPQ
ncbi:MAG: DUF4340 domain-containing protein [Acidobacteria bacterium]|nr:DUF4340 domain-containing protein [Acidobacteriota bacterium]